jgi:trypsin-like peptidase
MAKNFIRAYAAFCAVWLSFGCTPAQDASAIAQPPLDETVRRKVVNATLEIVPEDAAPSSAVGTAFSVGNGEFATAAHVLEDFIGSAYPQPVLRRSDGKRYRIDRVVKFTNEGDGELAVITLKDAPFIEALAPFESSLSLNDPLWIAGRRSLGGIDIRNAHVLPAERQPQSALAITFAAPATEGFSGGPLFDRTGAVLGLITRGDAAEGSIRATLMGTVADAEAELQVHALSLIREIGAVGSPRLVDPMSLEARSSFETFSSALLKARQDLYRSILFDPAKPRTNRFVFLGPNAFEVCELLNDARCTDAAGNTAGAETWRPPQTLARDALRVYNIHGAILIRDVPRARAVAGLRRNPRPHFDLAHRCFDDARLRVQLASSYDILMRKAARPPQTDDYSDTHGRAWVFRSWQLEQEDFYLVSLGRETGDGLAHIVLATVVPGSRRDGASVLLKYIANFTLAADGGAAPSGAATDR